jgi:hypothetical protein
MIYSQGCFKDIDDKDVCPEKRVFYRLISGMQPMIVPGFQHQLQQLWT